MLPKEYNYRPLLNFLTIKPSKIEGLGVFTLLHIKKDIDLGISHIIDHRFKDYIIRTPLGGFINHSNSPNCILKNEGITYKLYTLNNIQPMEELTLNYNKELCGIRDNIL